MTKRKVEDYQSGLRTKGEDLNECLEKQAELYYHVSDECEKYISQRDSIEYAIELREAELDLEIRKRVATTGEKATEQSIKMEIIRHPDMVNLNNKLLDTKALLGEWTPLRGAYDKRSKMLEFLVMREMRLLKDQAMERGTAFNRSQLVEAQSEFVTNLRRRKLGD